MINIPTIPIQLMKYLKKKTIPCPRHHNSTLMCVWEENIQEEFLKILIKKLYKNDE